MAYIAAVQAYGLDDDTGEGDGGFTPNDPAAPALIPVYGLGLDTTRQWLTGLRVSPRGYTAAAELEGVPIPTVDNLIAGTNITLTKDGADVTINASGGGGASPLTTKGDLYTYDTDNARLPIGTNGYVLTADDSQDTGMKWDAPGSASSPLTTKGDLYAHNGTANIRLPVGNDGEVLTADSAASEGVKWAPASGGGGDALISTIVLPNSTSTYSYAAVGLLVNPDLTLNLHNLTVAMTTVSGAVYKIGIAPFDNGTKKMTAAPTYCDTVDVPLIGAKKYVSGKFSTPFVMTAGQHYMVFYVRTDSTATVSQSTNWASSATGWGLTIPSSGVCHYLADTDPSTSSTWSYAGGSAWAFGLAYTL